LRSDSGGLARGILAGAGIEGRGAQEQERPAEDGALKARRSPRQGEGVRLTAGSTPLGPPSSVAGTGRPKARATATAGSGGGSR